MLEYARYLGLLQHDLGHEHAVGVVDVAPGKLAIAGCALGPDPLDEAFEIERFELDSRIRHGRRPPLDRFDAIGALGRPRFGIGRLHAPRAHPLVVLGIGSEHLDHLRMLIAQGEDVGKREGGEVVVEKLIGTLPHAVVRTAALLLAILGIDGAQRYAHRPVSYTHLDVYKRQTVGIVPEDEFFVVDG